MILTEIIDHGNVQVIRHYSNNNLQIRQVETGLIFDDAIDIVPCQFTYEETDTPIEDREIDAEEFLDIITGEKK